jgi:glycosyltransferase involved in cell wall biosynthesis
MKSVIFLGFKDLYSSPRGVENVVITQIASIKSLYSRVYYLHYGEGVTLKNGVISIGVGYNIFQAIFFILKNSKRKLINQSFVWSHNLLLSYFLKKVDILTIHDLPSRQFKGKIKSFVSRVVERLVLLKINKIHAVSEFTANIVKERHNIDTIRVVHNCAKFELNEYSTDFSIEHDHIDERALLKKKYSLAVRSLEDRANLFWLVDVFERLITKNKDTVLIICGTGPLYNILTNYISKKKLDDNIFLFGYVSDNALVWLYKKSENIIVSALSDEGFGLPVIEGYMFGKSVYVNNIDALPEVVCCDNYILPSNVLKASEIIRDGGGANSIDFKRYYHDNYSFSYIKESYLSLLY